MRDSIIASIMETEERPSSPFLWDEADQARQDELCSLEDDALIEELKNAGWSSGLKAGKAAGPYI